MQLDLHSYSTALYATWHYIKQLRVLFDAGDGVAAALLGGTGRLRHIFLSHADRDHLTGLLQLVQLNPLGDRLTLHYPADCGSYPALAEFCRRFDPHVPPPVWRPIRSGDEVALSGDRVVQAARNPHVPNAEDKAKSLSYFVVERKRTLKPEYAALPQKELTEKFRTVGKDALTEMKERRLIGYSADTPTMAAGFWKGCDVLLHEATFLNGDDAKRRVAGDTNAHSLLPDVLAMAKDAAPGRLILTHFSSRYDHDQIRAAVDHHLAEVGITFPVDLVLPGAQVKFALEV